MNLLHGFLHSPGHDTPWDGVHHPLDPPGSFGQSCVLLVGLVQVPVSVGSMIPCNVDGYTILYYTILYYTILYYTILYYTILYCIHTFIHACIHTYMHAYIHTYTYTYTHTDIQTYRHTYIQSYIYIYILYI